MGAGATIVTSEACSLMLMRFPSPLVGAPASLRPDHSSTGAMAPQDCRVRRSLGAEEPWFV